MTAAAAGLVLAAGGGSRFGGPKALVEVDGELLVDRALRVLHDAGVSPVVVVLGAAAESVRGRARLAGVVLAVNPDWADGIGSSLRAGLRVPALRGRSVVVTLVDTVDVSAAAVRAVIDGLTPAALAAVACYDGARGHPVHLAPAAVQAVATVAHGDVGARDWLRAHRDTVLDIDCTGLGSTADVDTPDQLARWRSARVGR